MTNTWYASDWDQAYCPSYAKIRRTVVCHIQVHLYQYYIPTLHNFNRVMDLCPTIFMCINVNVPISTNWAYNQSHLLVKMIGLTKNTGHKSNASVWTSWNRRLMCHLNGSAKYMTGIAKIDFCETEQILFSAWFRKTCYFLMLFRKIVWIYR